MARKRSAEKVEFWRSMIRRQRRQGLSIREFCRRNSISENSFYTWRRELERRDAERGNVGDRSGSVGGRSRGTKKVSNRLIPVAILDEGDSGQALSNRDRRLPLEIGTPDGFTLRFDDHASPETISRLLEVINRRQLRNETGRGGIPC